MTTDPQPTPLRRLRKRAEFLAVQRGRRNGRRSFTLQAAASGRPDAGIGLTVTKKTGNAPERNRIKRRLRAAVTACARDFEPGTDYVLVARREALGEPFGDLVASLSGAVGRLKAGRAANSPAGARPPDDVRDRAE